MKNTTVSGPDLWSNGDDLAVLEKDTETGPDKLEEWKDDLRHGIDEIASQIDGQWLEECLENLDRQNELCWH